MITILDVNSWSPALVTGNAEFIENNGIVYVVGDVRNLSGAYSFQVLYSQSVPPAPGPGSAFLVGATYTFPHPNTTFDPVAVLDPNATPHPVIHIVGTQNSISNPDLNDLIKFTYDTVAHTLTAPVTLSTGARVRSAYDITILPNSNYVVAMSLADPTLTNLAITNVVVTSDVLTLTFTTGVTVVEGQWLLLDGFTAATFLNGQVIHVLTATATTLTATFSNPNYSVTDSGTANQIGDSLLVQQRTGSDVLVANSAYILDSSPSRSGNMFDGVSLVPNGSRVELYYQAHPKVITFADQIFSVRLSSNLYAITVVAESSLNVVTVTSVNNLQPGATVTIVGTTTATWLNNQTVTVLSATGTQFTFTDSTAHGTYASAPDTGCAMLPAPLWNTTYTQIYSYNARYSDNRLTVIGDSGNNRYMSQTYWSQFNHPEGVLGNVFVGYKPSASAWSFRQTPGTLLGGSLAQSTLALDQSGALNLVYLLEPFEGMQNPPAPRLPAFPLHVANVNLGTLGLTDAPGFYNTQNFTWLRGTKSAIDNASVWAAVGECEVTTTVTDEVHTIPVVPGPYNILPTTTGLGFFQNVSVVYSPSLTPLTEVVDNPTVGQYAVEEGTGQYQFSQADADALIALSYQYISSITPSYISQFDVPPTAQLTPSPTATVWRNQAVTFSASASSDADSDAMTFLWSDNDPNLADVTLTPNGAVATLLVNGLVGGNERVFKVGVTVVDLLPDLVTQRHPALLVSQVAVSGNTVTLNYTAQTGSEVPIAGEQAMPWGLAIAAPLAPTTSTTVGGALAAQNLTVVVTYVNQAGESTGSSSTVQAVAANSLLTVTSPVAAGDATGYNVYFGETLAVLQTQTPVALGTTFTEPTSGVVVALTVPPTVSTAFLETINDMPLTLSLSTGTQLAGTPGTIANMPSTAVTGFVISQFQFQTTTVTVPQNTAPTITFPRPTTGTWNAATPPFVNVARNTQITITPTPNLADPLTQFLVVYTGITDPDDVVSYLWTQVSGTPLTLSGATSSALQISTSGANIFGEAMVFSLTVSDGINSPVTESFQINVAAYDFMQGTDSFQLSRSLWSNTASVTNVVITSGVATITALNTFLVGEPVRFVGLSGAVELNGVPGLVITAANATTFQFNTTLPSYPSASDTGMVYATNPIALRNTAQVWSPLDISIIYNNLNSVKRTSVLDGSDRYIVISPFSVLVYAVFASANPVAVLVRKLITPNHALILDAVHTEQDYTLVLDALGNLYRYSTAPLVNTDNPDTTLVLSDITSMSFADPTQDNGVKIFTTASFGNQRVLVLSGLAGALLVQVATNTLAVSSTLEFTTADKLLYGANKIQFVRVNSVDNTRTGEVLLGSVAPKTAPITNIGIVANTITVSAQNSFTAGDVVILSGLSSATFLNGLSAPVVSTDGSSFLLSYQYSGTYAPAADTGKAESQTSGTTFLTLVSLAQGQIIGTWDKTRLKNQYIETGEILFQPDSSYAGAPIPPVLNPPSSVVNNGQTSVLLTWQQERPDLITQYTVLYAVETPLTDVVPSTAPYQYQVSDAYSYTADEGVLDESTAMQITSLAVNSNVLTLFGSNTFSNGQQVFIGGATGLLALTNQTLTVLTASSSQITADFTNPNYGLGSTIAQLQVAANVLTVQTSAAHTFTAGTQVSFSSVGTALFLNGQTVTITGTTSNTFTANFTNANYSPTADSGTITDADTGIATVMLNQPLTSTASAPAAGQYNVTPTGLFTFNAAQAGHTVVLSIRQDFNVLQTINSGVTQSLTTTLPAGNTYFFEVQAFGPDGPSDVSNIQSITI